MREGEILEGKRSEANVRDRKAKVGKLKERNGRPEVTKRPSGAFIHDKQTYIGGTH